MALTPTSVLQSPAYSAARATRGEEVLHTPAGTLVLRRKLRKSATYLVIPRGLPVTDEELEVLVRPSDLWVQGEVEAPYPTHVHPPHWHAQFRPEQPLTTALIDVTKPLQEIRTSLSSRFLRNLKKADSLGVKVEASTDDAAIAEFLELHRSTYEPRGLQAVSEEYVRAICKSGTILIARHNGDPLAVALMLTHGNTTAYLFGGSTREKHPEFGDRKGSVALYWGMIAYATKQPGVEVLDLWGIPNKKGSHAAGVGDLKMQLHPEIVTYPGFWRALKPLGAFAYQAREIQRRITSFRLYRNFTGPLG